MNVVLATTLCIFINIIRIHTQLINTADNRQPPLTAINSNNESKSINNTQLERLLKQRDSILLQLQEAVEEGNKTIKINNNTQTLANWNNVQELYQNLLSDVIPPSNDDAAAGADNQTADARRHKEMKVHLFDFVSLSSKKKRHKDKQKELNRIAMQGKIDEWLLNRQLEKKKIKTYIERVKMAKLEKCPRQGTSRKKKRKTRRNEREKSEEEKNGKKKKKKKKKSKRGQKKYPCCRKCCKKSYLGCL